MKHDWYWADIKFREPQLIQVKPKMGSIMRLLSVGLNKQHGNAPDQPKLTKIETAIKELKDLFCNRFKRK